MVLIFAITFLFKEEIKKSFAINNAELHNAQIQKSKTSLEGHTLETLKLSCTGECLDEAIDGLTYLMEYDNGKIRRK